MGKKLTISRVKGFPLQLNKDHWVTLRQVYVWLKAQDQTTPEMDEVFPLLPDYGPSGEDFQEARETGTVRSLTWPNLKGSKTVRFRAEHMDGMIQLLKSGAAFILHGQARWTLLRRAEKLESVSELDLIADAAR